MKKFSLTMLLAVTLAVLGAAGSYAGVVVDVSALDADTTWEKDVLVKRPLLVSKGVTLTVRPGTTVRFERGAGLMVEGGLVANGAEGAWISFGPAEAAMKPGEWQGVNLNDSSEVTEMSWFSMSGANSLIMSVCSPEITNCRFTGGNQGFVLTRKAAPILSACTISDMSGGGIQVQMGSAPRVSGSVIENCGPYGIFASQDSLPEIRGNTVRGCETGISINKYAVALEDNLLDGNGTGISATSTVPEVSIRNNRVMNSTLAGIVCQQFSNPVVENNLIKENKQGIVCYRASSPLIRHNEITGNEDGIFCLQICNPQITMNSIHGNKSGVFLELSSYAVVRDNNFDENEAHVKLGDMMSSDWEQKSGQKPIRGSQAKNLTMADRGKAVRTIIQDDAPESRSVDASGNWWGNPTTAEMDLEGPDSDIECIVDYFDVKKRTYEGYEGEYVQDRVIYAGWKKEPVKGAGVE